MTKDHDIIIPNSETSYSNETLNLIDEFQMRLSRIALARYNLREGSLDKIFEILSGYKDVNPFSRETRRTCDNLKDTLHGLVGEGVSIDAEPNRVYRCIEVEISHIPKTPPKEIIQDGHTIAVLRPGRGSRESDLLVIGPNRLQISTEDIKIDSYNSGADPNKSIKSALYIMSNKERYGIPYGKLSIIAENQGGHRRNICITATENWDEPGNEKQDLIHVINSGKLGTQAYYDENGGLKNLGIYFKDEDRSIFGTYALGENPSYKIIFKSENANPLKSPEIKEEDDFLTIERFNIKYKFEKHLDVKGILSRTENILFEENKGVDI